MGIFFDAGDFPELENANTLIDDAEALAMLSAPCLADMDLPTWKANAARAILRGTILRWNDAGSGSVSQQSAGPFSVTVTPQVRRNSFWPSEVTDLQKICRTADSGKAFSIDTAPSFGNSHAAICAINFGATYCSCGASLTAGEGPLWEQDV